LQLEVDAPPFGTANPQWVSVGVMDNHGNTANVGTYVVDEPPSNFIVEDFSTSTLATNNIAGTAYTGSRVGPTSEFAPISSDNLYVYSNSPNVFVYPGSGSSSIINLEGDG